MYYNGILNGIALGVLSKKAEIPDYHLMVGTAEHLASLPLLVYQDYLNFVPEPLKPEFTEQKYEDVNMQADAGLSQNDFIYNTYFIGDALGGI